MPARDPLQLLNPQQRQAATTIEGPLLVLAGAGTGKTRTVTERIAYMLRKGIQPANILGVTFTNKAAGEMRERITKMAGKRTNLKDMIISTFHSLCVRILRRDAEALGYQPGFSICDQGEQVSLIRKASRHISGFVGAKPIDLLVDIGHLKNKGITPQQFARQASDDYEQTLASLYRRYQESLRAINAFDFDDLLLKTVELLETHAAAREHWQQRFLYCMVDEFQDTNAIQYRLVDLLAAPHNNLCVVGDDDQSIYGWRGAVAENILNFHHKYKGATVVRLEENYRSVNSILKAANAVIANNENRKEKTLWSSLGEGDPIRVLEANDQQNEAERVVTEIRQRLSEPGLTPSHFAVIMRTNGQTRPFEEEMRAARIPYAIIGGSSFFDQKEVRDVVAYLSAISNPRDDAALLRIINTPARGIGDKSVEHLSAYGQKHGLSLSLALLQAEKISALSAKAQAACKHFGGQLAAWRKRAKSKLGGLVRDLLTDIRYEDEVEHLYDDPMERLGRLNSAVEVGDSLRAYLEREPDEGLYGFVQEMMLMGRNDESEKEKREREKAVKLITVHSAKGLEFPIVYVVGMEEGLMPHKNSEEANTVDEERRLCYVALTRAQRELTLTRCTHRMLRGKPAPRTPSRFLQEIPDDLLRFPDTALSEKIAQDAIAEIRARLAARSADASP